MHQGAANWLSGDCLNVETELDPTKQFLKYDLVHDKLFTGQIFMELLVCIRNCARGTWVAHG